MSLLNKNLGPFNSTQINSKTTTQVSTIPSGTNGSGILKRIVVGVAGSADTTITVYDNTSTTGTPIIAISGGSLGNFDFELRIDVGIRVVTATGTAGTYYIIWN